MPGRARQSKYTKKTKVAYVITIAEPGTRARGEDKSGAEARPSWGFNLRQKSVHCLRSSVEDAWLSVTPRGNENRQVGLSVRRHDADAALTECDAGCLGGLFKEGYATGVLIAAAEGASMAIPLALGKNPSKEGWSYPPMCMVSEDARESTLYWRQNKMSATVPVDGKQTIPEKTVNGGRGKQASDTKTTRRQRGQWEHANKIYSSLLEGRRKGGWAYLLVSSLVGCGPDGWIYVNATYSSFVLRSYKEG